MGIKLPTEAALSCGHEPTADAGIGTGYATLPDGRQVCYACADAAQIEDMRTRNKVAAYASGDLTRITTWSGGTLARIVETGGTNRQTGRTSVRAVAADGSRWRAQVAEGTYCTLIREGTR